jgi:hypothetical protein
MRKKNSFFAKKIKIHLFYYLFKFLFKVRDEMKPEFIY